MVSLRIPPLRRHSAVGRHFLDRMTNHGEKRVLCDDALRTMTDYSWLGNVREFENSVERACALSSEPILHTGDLPTQLQAFHLHAYRTVLPPANDAPRQQGTSAVTPLAEKRQADRC